MEGAVCAHGRDIESAGKPPLGRLIIYRFPQQTAGVETSTQTVFSVCLIKKLAILFNQYLWGSLLEIPDNKYLCTYFQRIKETFYPDIPNPVNCKALEFQKGPCEVIVFILSLCSLVSR